MLPAIALLAFVTLQRLAELVWAQANVRRLKELGAVEVGARHYPVMVALHTTWLVALWLWGWDRPLEWPWVAAFFLAQLGRVWVLATLQRRWTTRVLVVPGETLVRRGPYRLVSHPNYVVVVVEIFVLPLAFSLWGLALAFGLANLALLAWRVRVEGRALAELRRHAPVSAPSS